MLILGGEGFYYPSDCDISGSPRDQNGAWYYPATDSWTQIGSVGSGHTSVWTGVDVITWGGQTEIGAYWDGFKWNPNDGTYVLIPSPTGFGPRSDHSAVWTGNVMIVWGGSGGGSHYSDGLQYNPVTELTTLISSAGAPSPRFGHSAVWTGSEMIVWGGSFGSYNFFDDGARYNPQNDSWTAISSINAPSGRIWHTTVWTGSEMIVFGGANGGEVFGDGASYDPITDTWTPLPTMNAPTARFGHTAIWTGEEMIVHGGTSAGYIPLSDGARYKLLADFIVAGMTNPPAELSPGGSFQVLDSTMNVGAGLSGRSVTGFYLSRNSRYDKNDLLLGSRDVPALQSGGVSQTETWIQVPADAKHGRYYLLACANNSFSEIDVVESNNCFLSFTRVNVK